MIKAIAQSGGIIGINYGPEFVYDKTVSSETQSKVADIAKHINHIKEVGGIDVLALGSDFDGVQGDLEIANVGEVDKLYNYLKTQAYTESELEKIWYKNALKVIKEIL
jgi:membrane dipeptidase